MRHPCRRRAPPRAPERYAIASCRERWLEFLGLEHETLSPAARLRARRRTTCSCGASRSRGRRFGDGRIPRPFRGAAPAAGGRRGRVLRVARLPARAGGPRGGRLGRCAAASRAALADAHARRRPVAGPSTPVVRRCSALAATLSSRAGRPDVAGRGAGARSRGSGVPRRGVAARASSGSPASSGRFRSSAEPAAAPARERCLGPRRPRAAELRRAGARREGARDPARPGAPRLRARASPLTPGGRFGLVPPAAGSAEARRRLRALAVRTATDGRRRWIAVAPGGLGRALAPRLRRGAALRLGRRGRGRRVPATRRRSRIARGLAAGALGSLRNPRRLGALLRVARRSAAGRRAATGALALRRTLASPGWARSSPTRPATRRFPSRPSTRAAAMPPPAPRAAARAGDPGQRDRAIFSSRAAGRRAARSASAGCDRFPGRAAEAWFVALGAPRGAPSRERSAAVARGARGRARDRRGPAGRGAARGSSAIVRAPEPPTPSAPAGAAALGRGRRHARRDRARRRGAPPRGGATHPGRAGRRGGPRPAAGRGGTRSRRPRATARSRCSTRPSALGPGSARPSVVETALARARVFALAGRFEEEDGGLRALRPPALGVAATSGSRRGSSRRRRAALLDRREYARAIVRLEEALGGRGRSGRARGARDRPRRDALPRRATRARQRGGARRRPRRGGRGRAARTSPGSRARNRVELLRRTGAPAASRGAGNRGARGARARGRRTTRRLPRRAAPRGRLALRRGDPRRRPRATTREARAARRGDSATGSRSASSGSRRATAALYEGDRRRRARAWESGRRGPAGPVRTANARPARGSTRLSLELGGRPAGARLGAARSSLRAGPVCAPPRRWRAGAASSAAMRFRRACANGRRGVLRGVGRRRSSRRASSVAGRAASPRDALRQLRGAVVAVLAAGAADLDGALPRLGPRGLARARRRGPGGSRAGRCGRAPEGADVAAARGGRGALRARSLADASARGRGRGRAAARNAALLGRRDPRGDAGLRRRLEARSAS